ncbi:MAG: hypothetical protein ACRCZF_07775, partial [Gemmataceae bacterium]
SLNASVQAFLLTVFLNGGFWIMLMLCCGLPMNLLGVRGRTLDDFTITLAGFTPPFVTGAVGFRNFENHNMEPFGYEWESNVAGLGIFSVPAGLAFWLVITMLFRTICFNKFRTMTNREPNFSAAERQMQRDYERKKKQAVAKTPIAPDNPAV